MADPSLDRNPTLHHLPSHLLHHRNLPVHLGGQARATLATNRETRPRDVELRFGPDELASHQWAEPPHVTVNKVYGYKPAISSTRSRSRRRWCGLNPDSISYMFQVASKARREASGLAAACKPARLSADRRQANLAFAGWSYQSTVDPGKPVDLSRRPGRCPRRPFSSRWS